MLTHTIRNVSPNSVTDSHRSLSTQPLVPWAISPFPSYCVLKHTCGGTKGTPVPFPLIMANWAPYYFITRPCDLQITSTGYTVWNGASTRFFWKLACSIKIQPAFPVQSICCHFEFMDHFSTVCDINWLLSSQSLAHSSVFCWKLVKGSISIWWLVNVLGLSELFLCYALGFSA